MKRAFLSAIAIQFLSTSSDAGPSSAAIAEFYQDKTIQLVVGYGAGGGYDLYARLVARFLGAHVPGNPTVVVRNMPGGGGRVAMGWAYSAAVGDGTVLVSADQGIVLDQALGDPAIKFDLGRMRAIGNPNAENNNLVTWHTSGIASLADATRREVTIGASPGAALQIPLALNAIVGTRFRPVLGYAGGNEIDLAMERGEVDGRGQNSFAAWKASKPIWIKEKQINFLVQWGARPLEGFETVPLLTDLANNEEDRSLLGMFTTPTVLGRPIFAPPPTPTDRVWALRGAFVAMVASYEFRQAAREGNFELNPVEGEQMEASIQATLRTPDSVRTRLKSIIAQGGMK